MIRFIDIGDQILEGERRFSLWSTVTDSYLSFRYTYSWTSWADFEDDFMTDNMRPPHDGDRTYLARVRSLCPDWAFTDSPGKGGVASAAESAKPASGVSNAPPRPEDSG